MELTMDYDSDLPEEGTLKPLTSEPSKFHDNIALIKTSEHIKKPGDMIYRLCTLDRSVPGTEWPADNIFDQMCPGLPKVTISEDDNEKEQILSGSNKRDYRHSRNQNHRPPPNHRVHSSSNHYPRRRPNNHDHIHPWKYPGIYQEPDPMSNIPIMPMQSIPFIPYNPNSSMHGCPPGEQGLVPNCMVPGPGMNISYMVENSQLNPNVYSGPTYGGHEHLTFDYNRNPRNNQSYTEHPNYIGKRRLSSSANGSYAEQYSNERNIQPPGIIANNFNKRARYNSNSTNSNPGVPSHNGSYTGERFNVPLDGNYDMGHDNASGHNRRPNTDTFNTFNDNVPHRNQRSPRRRGSARGFPNRGRGDSNYAPYRGHYKDRSTGRNYKKDSFHNDRRNFRHQRHGHR